MKITYDVFIKSLNDSIRVFGSEYVIPNDPKSIFTTKRLYNMYMVGGTTSNKKTDKKTDNLEDREICYNEYQDKIDEIEQYIMTNKFKHPYDYKGKQKHNWLAFLRNTFENDACLKYYNNYIINNICMKNDIFTKKELIKKEGKLKEKLKIYDEIVIDIYRELLYINRSKLSSTPSIQLEIITQTQDNLKNRFGIELSIDYIKSLIQELLEQYSDNDVKEELVEIQQNIAIIKKECEKLLEQSYTDLLGIIEMSEYILEDSDIEYRDKDSAWYKPHALKIDEQRYIFHQLKILLLINIIYKNRLTLSKFLNNSIYFRKKVEKKSVNLFKDFLKKNSITEGSDEFNDIIEGYESNLSGVDVYNVDTVNIDFIIKETNRLNPLNIKTHREFIKVLELFKLYETKKNRLIQNLHSIADNTGPDSLIYINRNRYCNKLYDINKTECENIEDSNIDTLDKSISNVYYEKYKRDTIETCITGLVEQRDRCLRNEGLINEEIRCNELLSIMLTDAYSFFIIENNITEDTNIYSIDLDRNSVCCTISAIISHLNLKVLYGHQLTDRDKTVLILLYLGIRQHANNNLPKVKDLDLLYSGNDNDNFIFISNNYEDAYIYCKHKGISNIFCKKILTCYKGIMFLYFSNMTTERITADTTFVENNNYIGDENIIFNYGEYLNNNQIAIALHNHELSKLLIFEEGLDRIEELGLLRYYDYRKGFITIDNSVDNIEMIEDGIPPKNSLIVKLIKKPGMKMLEEELDKQGIFENSEHYLFTGLGSKDKYHVRTYDQDLYDLFSE